MGRALSFLGALIVSALCALLATVPTFHVSSTYDAMITLTALGVVASIGVCYVTLNHQQRRDAEAERERRLALVRTTLVEVRNVARAVTLICTDILSSHDGRRLEHSAIDQAFSSADCLQRHTVDCLEGAIRTLDRLRDRVLRRDMTYATADYDQQAKEILLRATFALDYLERLETALLNEPNVNERRPDAVVGELVLRLPSGLRMLVLGNRKQLPAVHFVETVLRRA